MDTYSESVPRQGALQPMTVVELLDRTFRIYRQQFFSVIAPAALVTVIIFLLDLVLPNEPVRTINGIPQTPLTTQLLSLINSILLLLFVNAPLTYLTSEAVFGRQVTVGEALAAARQRWGALISGSVVGGLILSVVAIGAVVLMFGAVALVCLVPLAVVPLVYVIYLGSTLLTLLVPAVMLEPVSGTTGLWRGYHLTRQRFGYIVRLNLLTFILTLVLTLGAGVLLGVLDPRTGSDASYVLTLILNFGLQVLVLPLSPIAYTLAYYDARVRLEGLDMALSMSNNPDARPADVASPEVRTGLTLDAVDRRSLVWLAAVVIGVGVVFFGCVASLTPSLMRSFN